jgi:hypothetical protein
MNRLAFAAALALAAPPLAAQDNPFKPPKNKVPAVQISYTYTGDMQGTGEKAISKDRIVSHETTTSKFFGKTTNTDSWSMFTPQWNYTADLTKKSGVKRPNVLPYMEKAYDDLDGTSKKRLHQNMQDMAQMMARAFGTQTMWSGEKKGGTMTYAGERCEQHTFGTFSVCSMQDAPTIPLHVQGSLFCVDFEQTATAVKKGEPPASSFEPPSGITFQDDTTMANADSLAHGFVSYLASQQLSDSIAKAKAEMAKQPTASNASTNGAGDEPKELTPEEKAQQRQACEALKNFDLGKTMANAGKSLVNEAVNEAVEEKKAEVRNDAKNKIKGLIKKPHF